MTNLADVEPIKILLVEDNPADVRITREALDALGMRHTVHVVEDGLDAIAFLYQQGRYSGAQLPDLVMLDLDIPRVNGREVLLELKTNDRLRHISVVVLTGSRARRDARDSCRRGADHFMVKPNGLDGFRQEMRSIGRLLSRGAHPHSQ